jgi:hypothetical protein
VRIVRQVTVEGTPPPEHGQTTAPQPPPRESSVYCDGCRKRWWRICVQYGCAALSKEDAE